MAKDKIYLQVAAFLRECISEGKMKVGEAIYSENLLCEKLGVSRTSVRKAIRLMVEDNILETYPGKGTFIKSDGSGILHNRFCLINHYTRVLQYDVTDSYYSDIIFGAEAQTREFNLDFSVFSKEFHTPDEAKELFKNMKYDGVIIDSGFQTLKNKYCFLEELFKNAVIVDGNPEEGTIPVTAPDAEMGFSRLLELAAQRKAPVFFITHEHNSSHRWRKICFERAAKKAGIQYTIVDYGKNIRFDNFFHLDFNHFDHHPLIHEQLKEIAVPENHGATFICCNDYVAIKVISSLRRFGYRVPDDFAVSGFGGIGFSAYSNPALTTVKIDSELLSRNAVKILMDVVEKRRSVSELLPVGVIKRESL